MMLRVLALMAAGPLLVMAQGPPPRPADPASGPPGVAPPGMFYQSVTSMEAQQVVDPGTKSVITTLVPVTRYVLRPAAPGGGPAEVRLKDFWESSMSAAEGIRKMPPGEERTRSEGLLKDKVRQEFTKRQAEQRTEVKRLEGELAAAKARVEKREGLAEQIVARRVAELLGDDATAWEGDRPAIPPAARLPRPGESWLTLPRPTVPSPGAPPALGLPFDLPRAIPSPGELAPMPIPLPGNGLRGRPPVVPAPVEAPKSVAPKARQPKDAPPAGGGASPRTSAPRVSRSEIARKAVVAYLDACSADSTADIEAAVSFPFYVAGSSPLDKDMFLKKMPVPTPAGKQFSLTVLDEYSGFDAYYDAVVADAGKENANLLEAGKLVGARAMVLVVTIQGFDRDTRRADPKTSTVAALVKFDGDKAKVAGVGPLPALENPVMPGGVGR